MFYAALNFNEKNESYNFKHSRKKQRDSKLVVSRTYLENQAIY